MDRPEIFEKLNAVAERGGDFFAALRELPTEVVADAMLEIPNEYPSARKLIPRMAPDDIQDTWTGNHGHTLLFQSCAFIKAIELGYLKYTQRSLNDVRVLDYGCGWGRLIRLMYKYTAPDNIYGCDPMNQSIDLCKSAGLNVNLSRCDYLPESIPFPGTFGLVYAFSVFTHLSEDTAKTVLKAIRRSIEDDGLLVITIRPDSYWFVHQYGDIPVDHDRMHNLHKSQGYAYTPHKSDGVSDTYDANGEKTYGDTSFSLEYIKKTWTDWEVAGTDISLLDPYQTIVFLKPRNNR